MARVVRAGLEGGFAFRVGRLERDAQPDLDVPAGDADVLDAQSQELLFLDVVELVDAAADRLGEVVDVAVDLVAAG